MKKIILASTSPRRKRLLKLLGLNFLIKASFFEENLNLKMKPVAMVRYFSREKAKSVAKRYPRALVIGVKIISGYTIIQKNKSTTKTVSTSAKIKKLSSSEIKNYVKTNEPLDKAGAFAIQGLGSLIVEKISGDYYNVIGLPLFSLAKTLKKYKIKIF